MSLDINYSTTNPRKVDQLLETAIEDIQSIIAATRTPEFYGAVGDGVVDDTSAMILWLQQNGAASVSLNLVAGKNYKITSSLTFTGSITEIFFNGATITASFGTAYSTPIFVNDRVSSCKAIIHNPRIRGNCVFVDLGFTADSPGAGLSLSVYDLDYNTNDGNLRPGTGIYKLEQVDFIEIRKGTAWNCDLGFNLSKVGGKRDSTQLVIDNYSVNQVRSGLKLKGTSKVRISGFDILKCASGFSLDGGNSLIIFEQCHVEGLGLTGFQTASTLVSTDSQGVGFNVADDQDNSNIKFIQCDTLDIGGTGGTATASARVGKNFNISPRGQSVIFEGCSFATTMCGSSSYVPFINRGKFKWEGPWTFLTNFPYPENGLNYIDMDIRDPFNTPYRSNSYFTGNTCLSIIDGTGGTAPTVTEFVPSFNQGGWGHEITFNAAGYKYVNRINPEYGFITLDVVGYKLSGNPLLVIQMVGAPFTTYARLQFNGLSDQPRRWRITVWNPTPNQSLWVGLESTNIGDSCRVMSIDCYPGFGKQDIDFAEVNICTSLPTPSVRWYGKRFVTRNTGVADTHHICVRDSSNAYVMKQITMT